MSSDKRVVKLKVNGATREVLVEPRLTLADLLREEMNLTGTHLGCEHGVCGACTVLVDGRSVRSCLMLAVQANGMEVETVEGLAKGEQMHPIQEAFWENHGLQCGFCTPAMMLRAKEMLSCGQPLDKEQVREGISGILCRCTGYQNIVTSVLAAQEKLNRPAGD